MKNFASFTKKDSIPDPTGIKYPAFLMCPPFNVSSENPNNVFMKNMPPAERVIDKKKALNQWLQAYNFLSNESLVYLLPSVPGLQDQVYVANLGVVLPHYQKGNTVVIAEFRSPPRVREQIPGMDFFRQLGYDVRVAPKYFEGEADLKYFGHNNYIGAYGIRTSIEALNWFEHEFDMNIVKVENRNEKAYHLDCLVFPMYEDKCLATTSLLTPQNIKDIEKFADIIEVPEKLAWFGVTNLVGIYKTVMCASSITNLKSGDKYYDEERAKVDFLEKTCIKNNLELVLFDLSELKKSGADLSCCVMNMNFSYMKGD